MTDSRGIHTQPIKDYLRLALVQHNRIMSESKGHKVYHWNDAKGLARHKKMVIVGYGENGATLARIAREQYGLEVIGVKRNPKEVSSEWHRDCCD